MKFHFKVRGVTSRGVTCQAGSRSVTSYPTQVNSGVTRRQKLMRAKLSSLGRAVWGT